MIGHGQQALKERNLPIPMAMSMPPLVPVDFLHQHQQMPSTVFNSDDSVFSGDKTAFLIQEEQAFMENLN